MADFVMTLMSFIGMLLMCSTLPLRRADGGQLLAVRRGRVATLSLKTDASCASREFSRASELDYVNLIDM